MNSKHYVDVDTFQRDASVENAASLCGVPLEVTGSGRNLRIDCPFGCEGDHASKREIVVDVENAAKQWKCHAYGCQVRGNLLNLMYGWINGRLWSGAKLRGEEFKQVKQRIAEGRPPDLTSPPPVKQVAAPAEAPAKPIKCNGPLLKSEHEPARQLMQPPLWEKLRTDVAQMSPPASAYVRRHPSLSSEAMAKWHVGELPKDGGGDKRGWSLRSHILYPLFSEEGEVLCFVGRDPDYENKLKAFEQTPPEERDAAKRPIKHKFPKGFHRGQELYGQQRQRLEEPGYREVIAEHGIIVTEGFNDVIRLDNVGIPSVALCSNLITEEQVAKLKRWTQQLRTHVSLLLDCDTEGDDGAKDAAWKLLQAGIDVRALWGRSMHGGAFVDRQPESLTSEELEQLLRR